MRFFAGLHFLYRWIGLAMYASASSYNTFFTMLEILLLIILALHAICQPYIKRTHNIIDTLLITDLAIINAMSCMYYSVHNYGEKQNKFRNALASAQLVLIYLPVTTMAVYVFIKYFTRLTKLNNTSYHEQSDDYIYQNST